MSREAEKKDLQEQADLASEDAFRRGRASTNLQARDMDVDSQISRLYEESEATDNRDVKDEIKAEIQRLRRQQTQARKVEKKQRTFGEEAKQDLKAIEEDLSVHRVIDKLEGAFGRGNHGQGSSGNHGQQGGGGSTST
ncbi:MAG: hypothetical protein Q9162_002653 [Coniocarpon cinnabarinum]